MADMNAVNKASITIDQASLAGTDSAPAMDALMTVSSEQPYSIFTQPQKRLIIILVSTAASFSPFASNILYGATNDIARDIHVSRTDVTWCICCSRASTSCVLAKHW